MYIVVLNWNNYEDTVKCVESVLGMEYECSCIIVVDNGSYDDSREKIVRWFENNGLSFDIFSYKDGNFSKIREHTVSSQRVSLIVLEKNLGYAGGNNVGMSYALGNNDCDFVWILNNDTIVEPMALSSLVECALGDEAIAMVGSKLVYYDGRAVQCAGGGKVNPITGNSTFFLHNAEMHDKRLDIKHEIDYVSGASLLVKVEAIRDVGMLDERYFLYWEDADWGTRARRKGYRCVYCPGSIVYHKEGGTTRRIMFLNDYYWVRNGLFFMKKFYPFMLPLVFFFYFAKYTLVRALKREKLNFKAYVGGVVDFLRSRSGAYDARLYHE